MLFEALNEANLRHLLLWGESWGENWGEKMKQKVKQKVRSQTQNSAVIDLHLLIFNL